MAEKITKKEMQKEIDDLKRELEIAREKSENLLQPIIDAVVESSELEDRISDKVDDAVSNLSIS